MNTLAKKQEPISSLFVGFGFGLGMFHGVFIVLWFGLRMGTQSHQKEGSFCSVGIGCWMLCE